MRFYESVELSGGGRQAISRGGLKRLRDRSRIIATIFGAVAALLIGISPIQASAVPASTNACAGPPSGPGIQAAVQYFNFPQVCGSSTILRQGNTVWGLTHIEIGGQTGNTTNHETTTYAKSIWQQALNQPPLTAPVGGYYKHGVYYTTPAGNPRVMCVYVDINDRDGYGQRGIITAFWIASSYISECLTER